MNDRTENLTLQHINALDLVQSWREEITVSATFRDLTLIKQLTFILHHFFVLFQAVESFFVNHRTYVSTEKGRIADTQFLHRADEHIS